MIYFKTSTDLIPVIIQNTITLEVLMLGYMNNEAYEKTKKEGIVTFFSRSKNRLWTKGESSGNYLYVKEVFADCDADTLLIKVVPNGATCHTGSSSCFGPKTSKGFLYELETTIQDRINAPGKKSYVCSLYEKGINKIAQKVGEEAVELIIEAKDDNPDLFKNEAADLLFHFLILLKAKKTNLNEIETLLLERSKK